MEYIFTLLFAFGIVVIWTLSTYLLERKRRTFLKAEEGNLRLTYNLISNILIGLVIPGLSLFFLVNKPGINLNNIRLTNHSLISIPAGFLLGIALFYVQKPPTNNIVILLNGFFQVLTVSIAEIFICWGLLGTILELTFTYFKIPIPVWIAGIISSIVFGIYHVGHSHPFYTVKMILTLSIVGLFTSAFFFISRNIFGTLLFHNFLALYGVIGSLMKQNKLQGYETINWTLILTALSALTVMKAIVVLI